jgi:PhoH-like ATPase
MSEYTGVRVVSVRAGLISELYQEKVIPISFDRRRKPFSQNEYVVLKDEVPKDQGGSASALCKVYGEGLHLLREINRPISGVKPKNKEQHFAFDALLDRRVPVVVLTGSAGTGKTLLTLAAALHLVDKKEYEKIILTKPMSWVGKHGLGALPGDVDEKFNPYLENYMCNIEHLLNGSKRSIPDMIQQYNFEFIPLQLIRGASWHNAFVIADEVQTLDYHEMVTLGTRLGEGSKLVIMGDLGQRDENIARDKTGIHKFVNSTLAKQSSLVSSIELIKCERSPVAELFANVFGV